MLNPELKRALLNVHSGPVQKTGFDPEIFVVDATGKLIPAFDFLPSKENPLQVPHPNGGGIGESGASDYARAYWDGFQAEFTTRPFGCHGWCMDELHSGLQTVRNAARKYNPSAKLTLKNVFEIPFAELMQTSAEFVTLGCDPSLNAYGTDPFYIDNPFELPYRMAGGHIHLALPHLTENTAKTAVKYLDLLVGLPMVGMFAEIDVPTRRKYYGRAGEFRRPSHGLEYRTLSNAWLGHPAVSNLVADLARLAVGNVQRLVSPKDLGTSHEAIRDIIDSTDVAGARKLFNANEGLWDSVLQSHWGPKSITKFSQAVNHSVEDIIPTYRDVETNWGLNGTIWHSKVPGVKSTWSEFSLG